MKPPLIIVSGPSGSGKSTLINGVVQRYPDRLRLAVSATTRKERSGEEHGKHYYFVMVDEFEKGLAEGRFLEHAKVHGANYYGTPRAEVEDSWKRGLGVFLDIDVQGAERVRKVYPDHLSVFVKLSAFWMYGKRLEERGEGYKSIARRLDTAADELARIEEYQHQIVNDDGKLERATGELEGLIRKRFPDWLPD